MSSRRVSWKWVRGHSGHPLNEEADSFRLPESPRPGPVEPPLPGRASGFEGFGEDRTGRLRPGSSLTHVDECRAAPRWSTWAANPATASAWRWPSGRVTMQRSRRCGMVEDNRDGEGGRSCGGPRRGHHGGKTHPGTGPSLPRHYPSTRSSRRPYRRPVRRGEESTSGQRRRRLREDGRGDGGADRRQHGGPDRLRHVQGGRSRPCVIEGTPAGQARRAVEPRRICAPSTTSLGEALT